MKNFKGKVAVVTGAAGGIGQALAERFARERMSVVLTDIEAGPLEQAVSAVRALGAEAIGVRADVSRDADVAAVAERAIAEFGAVHILCNNAGVETGGRFADIPVRSWEWVFGVNVWGVIHGCRAFLPILRQQDEAHIVNTGSMSAFTATTPTFAPYAASKFAVLALTESLAAELKGGPVGVSFLVPGATRTNMVYSERNRPDSVAATHDDPARRAILKDIEALTVQQGQDPAEVAQAVVEAIRENAFYILMDPPSAIGGVRLRLDEMETAADAPFIAKP